MNTTRTAQQLAETRVTIERQLRRQGFGTHVRLVNQDIESRQLAGELTETAAHEAKLVGYRRIQGLQEDAGVYWTGR
jgi:hypothetical protein